MFFRHFSLAIFLVVLSGCVSAPTGPTIGSQSWYDGRMQEIDQAYLQGKLTKEQQLTLKNETDRLRLIYQREEDNRLDRHMLLNRSLYSRPLYDCNNGVCTPVSP